MIENANPKTRIQEELDKRKKKDNEVLETGKNKGKNIYPFVRFVWPDGHEQAFAYAHLSKLRYELTDDTNIIEVVLSKERITIKGYQLHSLYMELINHTVSQIVVKDETPIRLPSETKEPYVIEAEVKDYF